MLLFLSSCSYLANFNPLNGGSTGGSRGLNVVITTSPQIQGKTLNENEGFTVAVDVTNNIASPIQGVICLRDQTTDSFGGIPSSGENCDNLNLQAAEMVDKSVYPYRETYYFPKSGDFKYRNLESISQNNQIFVDLIYEAKTQNGGSVCIEKRGIGKCPQIDQNVQLQNNDASLDVSRITANPSFRENQIILNLEISLRQKEDGKLLTPGSVFSPKFGQNQKVKFNVLVEGNSANCKEANQGYVEFRKDQNEKIIKCSAPVTIPVSHEFVPVIVNMEYAFQKTITGPSFTLKKEEGIYA